MTKNWIEEQELRFLARAKNSKGFSTEQRAAVERIDTLLAMKGMRLGTRIRFALKANRLGVFVGRPFEEVTREDLARFFGHITQSYTPEGVRFMKSFVRRFYTLLLSPYDEKIPEVVSWIKVVKQRASHQKPVAVFKPEEVRRLLEVARSERDRALISVLYESGTRVSELCGLSIGDVEFDKYGARITVDGKTGVRRVRLIQSAVDLRKWLDLHPYRSDKEAPLFVRFLPRASREPLMQSGVRFLLKKTARVAGISKRPNPHAFRKARATELSQRLTPSELSVYHGWVQGSSMPRVYIHLAGDDVEKKLLQQAGILEDEKITTNALAPHKCFRCGDENSAASAYCSKCSMPLDAEKARLLMKEEDELRDRAGALARLIEDPEVAALLTQKLRMGMT